MNQSLVSLNRFIRTCVTYHVWFALLLSNWGRVVQLKSKQEENEQILTQLYLRHADSVQLESNLSLNSDKILKG